MYQHRYFYFITFRWEIFRKQRELDKAEQSEVERKRMFKTFYLKYIHSFYVFKSIFNMYDIRQKQKILEHRKLYCCNRIKRRVLKLLQRFAPSIEERQINSVRYSLNSVMDFVYEPQLKKSKYIL